MIARARGIEQAREEQSGRFVPPRARLAAPDEREEQKARQADTRIRGIGDHDARAQTPPTDVVLARARGIGRLEEHALRDDSSPRTDGASGDRERVRSADDIAPREHARTQAGGTVEGALEPGSRHRPAAPAAERERPGELSHEELRSTGILTGSADDDDVQAEKPASQRL